MRFGFNPWWGLPVSALAGASAGWLISVLSFRAGLKGSYFALITLAFAEVFRIISNSIEITGGGLGMLIGFTVLPIQIYNWVSRPQAPFLENAAAGIIVLLLLLLTMQTISQHKHVPQCEAGHSALLHMQVQTGPGEEY